jgi:hypothetical protein
MLQHDLTNLRKQPKGYLHHATSDMRLLHLKNRRSLAGFLLYFHFVFELQHPTFKKTKFGDTWMHTPEVVSWLSHCREVLEIYNHIPSSEYWAPTMFDGLLAKINLVRSLGRFECAEQYQHLIRDMQNMIGDMEHMTESGTRPSGVELRVYNHQGLINNDFILSDGEPEALPFFYHDCGLLDIYRSQSRSLHTLRLDQLKTMSSNTDSLSENKHLRHSFFKAVNERLLREV